MSKIKTKQNLPEQEKQPEGGDGGGDEKQKVNVSVRYGAQTPLNMPFAGMKVGDVRESLETTWNIPEDAYAVVNGEKVSEDYILQDQDNLEFVREAGAKGD